MSNMTICLLCNHCVHVAPGFCALCGNEFVSQVIRRQVAAVENNYDQTEDAELPIAA